MRREAGHARALIILFLGLLGGLAVLLNPNAQHHQQAIHDAVADRYPVAGAAGLDVIAAHLPDYHSWWFGSYTTMGGRTTSVGAFDYVWVDIDAFKP